MCVLILLNDNRLRYYVSSPHTSIYVSSYSYMCLTYVSHAYTPIHMTTIYVSSYSYIYMTTTFGASHPVLVYMSPHTTIILLYMCPHTTIWVLILLYMCPHTTICVLILLHMSPHTTMCPHTIMERQPAALLALRAAAANTHTRAPICARAPVRGGAAKKN